MTRFSLTAAAALAAALFPALASADDEAPYRDAAEVRAELVKVLSCKAERADYLRLANAVTEIYYDKPAQPALKGWSKAKNDNAFVVVFDLPEPVTVYGRPARQLMMAGEGILAVLDGDIADKLAGELKLEAASEPLAGHIRVREVRSDDLGDGVALKVVQTVSTIASHPGKTMAGCEYRMSY